MSWSVGHTTKQKGESENSRESAHGANAAPDDIAAAGGSGDEPPLMIGQWRRGKW
jgi:hypothetical protein